MKNLLTTIVTNSDTFESTIYVFNMADNTLRYMPFDELSDSIELVGVDNINYRQFIDLMSKPVDYKNEIEISNYKWMDIDYAFSNNDDLRVDNTLIKSLYKTIELSSERLTKIKQKIIMKNLLDFGKEGFFNILNMDKPSIPVMINDETAIVPAETHMFDMEYYPKTDDDYINLIMDALSRFNPNKETIYLYMFSHMFLGNRSVFRIRFGKYPNSK